MQPTRTTQVGCNIVANFQACLVPCLSELRENLLAWSDDGSLSGKYEEEHLGVLSTFLQLCAEYGLVISL